MKNNELIGSQWSALSEKFRQESLNKHRVFTPESPELSFVIPAHNEAENIKETISSVAEEAQLLVRFFEILIIDDGSHDDTLAIANELAKTYPLRTIRLSRNFGKEQAIMAGLTESRGKAVMILDADLQEPIAYLPEMWAYYQAGYEMVYGVRANRDDESKLKRMFTAVFYKLLRYSSDVEIPVDARDFRLMDRKVVDALCDLPERNRFMKGLYSWVGFKSKAISIELKAREKGQSKFGFKNLLKLAMTGLFAFTNWPLRVWTGVGLVLAMLSISYGLWIVVDAFIWGITTPGWSTTTVAVFFLGGIQLISIGVLGEYLARVFTEVKGRPGYIIAKQSIQDQPKHEPAWTTAMNQNDKNELRLPLNVLSKEKSGKTYVMSRKSSKPTSS